MEWLRQIPIFANLDADEMENVIKLVNIRKFRQNEIVFYEGEEREAVYFVRNGTLKVFKIDEEGREQIISFLREGEMFPHVGFFDETPYPGTAKTQEECELGVISIRDFEKLVLQHPKIAIKVMRVLGGKILDLQQKLQDVTLQTASDRIIHTLLHLSESFGEVQNNGILLTFRITNQELANMVGTTRETANRVLNDFRRRGFIDYRTEGIWISNELK